MSIILDQTGKKKTQRSERKQMPAITYLLVKRFTKMQHEPEVVKIRTVYGLEEAEHSLSHPPHTYCGEGSETPSR